MRAFYLSNYKRPSLVSSNCSYIASFAANIKVMYLASIDDKATVTCFLED